MAKDYDPLTKLLHWLVFVLVAAQYAVGEFMPHIGRKAVDEGLIAWHFSLGAAVLVTIVVALAWRIIHPVAQSDEIPLWQKRIATLIQWALYLLILVMSVLGWAATNARGWPVKLFGVIPFPALANNGDKWAHTAGDIHTLLVNVLLALAAVHVGAALYHHFIARDRMLKRMLP
jgi:cytochrome b561